MKKAFLIIFLGLLISFFIPNLVWAGGTGCPTEGLVPCGNVDTCPCELCDLFVMLDRWIDGLLFMFVPITAALMIAIGGVMYIISQGNPEMLGRAKKLFTAVVVGLVITYGAWLIINLFLTVIGATVWQGPGQGWWIFPCS